jgi:hypothetical protein
MQKSSLILLVLLGLLLFVYNLGNDIYLYNGWERIPTWDFLYQAAFLSGVVWAVKADARKSAVQSIYCSGFILSIGWFFAVPYHLFKTRGAVGLLPILALLGCIVVGRIVALVLYLALFTVVFQP